MADLLTSERSSLNFFAKQKNKYGSLSKNSLRRHKAINHIIQPSDTLQGIALKYGVSMEEIKRVNKLWTTDSLFLRTSLSIPVPSDFSQTGDNTTGADMQKPSHCNDEDPQTLLRIVTNNENALRKDFLDGRQQDETINDFLVRVDSNIAHSRDKVQLLERKRSGSESLCSEPRLNLRRFKTNTFSASTNSDLPQTTVMQGGRKVSASMGRHEKQQDQLFEL